MIDRDRIIEPRPMVIPQADRRRYPRQAIARTCKVRALRDVRYLPAVTADVSSGGVRLDLVKSQGIEVGDRVELAISWHGHPTVSHGETIPATVVRLQTEGEHTAAGLAFDAPIAIESIIDPRRAA